MEKISVFLDTNVIIASLLSNSGASSQIIKNPKLNKIISKTVKEEILEVSIRLNLNHVLINSQLDKYKIITPKITKKVLENTYGKFVFDQEDSHVVAGTHSSKTKFLITHNLKHFNINRINSNMGIIVLTPGNFLQYLRSLK